jgi:predicted ATPase
MPGVQRPFEARELSDGTLRYLCLIAALLSARSPSFIVLNEPETSIHGDLIQPLARLIAQASERSQIWVITHSEALAAHIEAETGRRPIRLEKVEGETRIVGQRLDGSLEDDE